MFDPGKSLNIGIPEIDEAHEKLDRLAKKVERSIIANVSVAETRKHFLTFISATETHFENEKRVFSQYGLPGMNAHRAEHKSIIQLLTEAESSISETNDAWRKTLMDLMDILTRHIVTFDFEVKTHRGVKH